MDTNRHEGSATCHLKRGIICRTIAALVALLVCDLGRADDDLRTMRYTSRTAEAAEAWQRDARHKLFDALKMSDLVNPMH